jgi:hypothetical protein
VAYTASLDEEVALGSVRQTLGAPPYRGPQPFRNQLEWLSFLVDMVGRSHDLQLVVRVHPREGPNRSDPTASQHVLRLKAAFDRPLPNCRFVWPEEPISSYDLAEIAHVGLTSWSTIGMELARFGIPLLIAFRGHIAFPAGEDFVRWAGTSPEYAAELRSAIGRPVTLESLRAAYRWYHLNQLGHVLNLSDVIPAADFLGVPVWRVPEEAQAIEEAIVQGRDVLEINLERLRGMQHDTSEALEAAALRAQLRRLVHFLCRGERAREDFVLRVRLGGHGDAHQPLAVSPSHRLLAVTHECVSYHGTWGAQQRYSPMIARMAAMAAMAAQQAE